jgi:hypothetical protein
MIRGVAIFLGLLFFSVGTVLLSVAIDWTAIDNALADNGLRAEGTVTDLVKRRGYRHRTTYHPLVVFRDEAGRERRFTSDAGRRRPAYDIGERVPVIYDAAEMGRAEIDGFVERRLGAIIFGVFGSIFSVMGVVVLYGLIRGWRQGAARRGR